MDCLDSAAVCAALSEVEKHAFVVSLRGALINHALESRPRGVGEPGWKDGTPLVTLFDHIDEHESARIKRLVAGCDCKLIGSKASTCVP